MTPLALTVSQAAQTVSVHPDTIYRALWSGELAGHQRKAPKGAWRIRPADLEAWALGANA